jgi:signal transduction histidine kinase
MNVATANEELPRRWSEWLLERNRRGMRSVLWIVACLYPAFGVLDYLVAPRRWLGVLYGTRVAVTLVTLGLFRVLSTELFRRHPILISAAYMVLISLGISLMTVFMGGLGSPYYAGLSLVMVASGLLFVWPPPVVAATFAAIVAGFLAANLIGAEPAELLTAIQNQFFLFSTAIIAGTGQMLAYRSQREQVQAELAREEASRHLEHAHTELERLDRFKSEFFANITHELKTPLTLILAPLGLLVDGELGAISDAQRSTLESMQRSGVKLSRLINDLLDLSKLEESRLRLRVDCHDLVAYLESLVEQVEPLAQRKNISLSFEADVPRAEVWCDIERLERVFLNVLSNATKFTLAGGRVRIALVDEGAAVRIEVIDDGVGFPSEMSEEVFQRFFQADMANTRRFGGAGIGLSLARELVELHGGGIWARSAPGQGATFTVRLVKDREHFAPDVLDRRVTSGDRLRGQREEDRGLSDWQLETPEQFRLLDIDEATDQRSPDAEEVPIAKKPTTDLGHDGLVARDRDEHSREHSVLVVEDTPDVARVIRLALHQQYRILVAGDGQQGLELARRHRPSIIITDWMMPRMDGLALTAELRRDPLTRDIPIVMLTAKSDVQDKVRGLETGVSAFVAKPFSASEITSTLRSLQRARDSVADSLLTQKLDSLETIAGGLAHEIMNPLNYLKNALAAVQRDSQTLVLAMNNRSLAPPESGLVRKLEQRMQRMFEVSEAGVKRIASTVDLMIRYSREGYARSMSPYDAYAAVRDVVLVVGPSVARDVRISLDLAGNGWICCVAEEFNQVLSNLIQNALEAVAPLGTGGVFIKGRNDGSDLTLSIRDDGPGVPESERARIFDAFYTTKPPGHGMGLGLTITRRVIVSLGGTLTLKAEPGKGSEFIIRVPSAAACEAAG